MGLVHALDARCERLNLRVLALAGWRRTLLPPLLAFVVANLVLSAAVSLHGKGPLESATWSSWDSPIYLDIAARGYSTYECPAWEVRQGAEACGTVGWFPLYPAAIAVVEAVGVAPSTAGVVVSLAFWLALLVVVWNGLLLRAPGRSLLPALALAAFMPGAFYFHTIYPVAMAACLLAIAAVMLRDRRWLPAGVAGLLATATYPAAGALVAASGLWLLLVEPAPSWLERARRIALVCGLTVAGFAAVLGYQWIVVGEWDGYFGVQARFDHGVHLPFANWLDISRPRFEGLGNISLFLAFQSWFTTFLVLCVAVSAWRRRRELASFDRLIVLWAFVFWIVPLMQNTVAYYRTDTLLAPVVVAFVRLPVVLVLALAGVGAVIAAGMAIAFTQGILV